MDGKREMTQVRQEEKVGKFIRWARKVVSVSELLSNLEEGLKKSCCIVFVPPERSLMLAVSRLLGPRALRMRVDADVACDCFDGGDNGGPAGTVTMTEQSTHQSIAESASDAVVESCDAIRFQHLRQVSQATSCQCRARGRT